MPDNNDWMPAFAGMTGEVNNNFDILPEEIKLYIVSFLAFSDLDNVALVNKNFLNLSNLAWADKLRDEFNYQPKTVSEQKFFYRRLPVDLARERQLIILLLQLEFAELYLMTNTSSNSNLNASCQPILEEFKYIKFTTDNSAAYKNIIQKLIQHMTTAVEGDEAITFQNGLITAEKKGAALFDKLLAIPHDFSEEELQAYLRMLCRVEASHLLTNIIKKHQAKIDFVDIFEVALHCLNLNMMQKLIELGLDIKQNVIIFEENGNAKDSWLTFLVIYLEEILLKPLNDFSNSGRAVSISNMAELPGIKKIKDIINFYLEAGIDPKQHAEINTPDDQDKPSLEISCQLLCEWYLEELEYSTNPFASIGKDILEGILNYSPKPRP